MRIIIPHNILRGFFGICLCWYLILKKSAWKSLKFSQKWQFLYLRSISAAIFVTIATIKLKQILELYTSTILLVDQMDEICEKQLSVFGSRGGQISPLMHVPLRKCRVNSVLVGLNWRWGPTSYCLDRLEELNIWPLVFRTSSISNMPWLSLLFFL